MCPSLIEIGSKTAEKNSAQTNKQTNRDRHYENNDHLAVNQYCVADQQFSVYFDTVGVFTNSSLVDGSIDL